MSPGEREAEIPPERDVEPTNERPVDRRENQVVPPWNAARGKGPELISDLFCPMSELPKTYSPNEVEKEIYQRWLASGFFNPDNLPGRRGKPFVISMPPPNITGELHLGHALGMTVQDLLIRFERMRGRRTLWVPGTDHAAIATQVVVERALKKEGIDRVAMGREKFLEHVWAWKEQYGARIIDQVQRLGASADWSRQRFTMDDGMGRAVQTAFVRLHREGLIYRGERIIHWCPDCQTGISDIEVDHQQTPGTLWYLRYPLSDESGSILVATTRPETMLGDTAVAVHPDDQRYRELIGKTVRLPIVDRDIPIIADPRIEREFGTGAVKVTPAHDPLDWELGQTHHLPAISVIGQDGRITANGGPLAGRTVAEARRDVVARFEALSLLDRQEDYVHSVAMCSRSKTIIEPMISLQWFVSMKPLAAKAIAAVKKGQTKIVPERFEKTYFHWLENIRDWNISRQIWWGHRLPVWYRTTDGQEEVRVAIDSPGAGWRQDEDTLDTWFSSGLWTFSTLGWPGQTKDLKRFHPTDVMETGWDILFFWVARMMMLSLHFLGTVPFKTIYLHGLILDAEGKKMSKSKGTGIDPLPMQEKYGTDAVRLSLLIGNAPGMDFRMSEEKIAGYRNFANKLWNISRFAIAHQHDPAPKTPSVADRWILARMSDVVDQTTTTIEQYQFSTAGQTLYDFVWHDVADWYLEWSKIEPNPAVLMEVIRTTMKLLHPFMPFITERIWGELGAEELLLVAPWPKKKRRSADSASLIKSFARHQSIVSRLRVFRLHAQLGAGVGEVVADDQEARIWGALAGISLRVVRRLPVSGETRPIVVESVTFQFPAEAVARFDGWREKEGQRLSQYVAAIKAKLANEKFRAHAPATIIAGEEEKIARAEAELQALQ